MRQRIRLQFIAASARDWLAIFLFGGRGQLGGQLRAAAHHASGRSRRSWVVMGWTPPRRHQCARVAIMNALRGPLMSAGGLEMNRKRSKSRVDRPTTRFFCESGDATGPFFRSATPQIILPSRPSFFGAAARRGGQGWPHLRRPQGSALTGPSTAARWRGTGLHSSPGWNSPSVATMVVGRGRPRVARRLQASPDRPIVSCRAEAPARRFLAAAVSIAPRSVRSFAPPGRQSASRGRAAP